MNAKKLDGHQLFITELNAETGTFYEVTLPSGFLRLDIYELQQLRDLINGFLKGRE